MFQTIPFSFLKSLGVDELEWLTIQAFSSCMCSFNRGSIEWSNLLKICIWCMCIINYACFMFDWISGWDLLFGWEKLKLCKFAYDRVGYPDVTLCSWHQWTLKSTCQLTLVWDKYPHVLLCQFVVWWIFDSAPSPPPPPPPPFSTKSVLHFEWIWGPGRRGWLGTEIWVNL